MNHMQRIAAKLNILFQDSCFLILSSNLCYLRHTQKSLEKECVSFLSGIVAVPEHAEEAKEAMRTGNTVSVEDSCYLATDERKVTWKHDAKAEVSDTYHDSFINLSKREIQHSCTVFKRRTTRK